MTEGEGDRESGQERRVQPDDAGVLKANMGSCQCGNVYVPYIIDSLKKRVYVPSTLGEAWMQGYVKGTKFFVPYAGSVDLGAPGFEIVPVRLEGFITLEELRKAVTQ